MKLLGSTNTHKSQQNIIKLMTVKNVNFQLVRCNNSD